MKSSDIDVSIIIVNYNTSALLKNCIDSIYKYTTKNSYEVIVSDNESRDDSIRMLKHDYPNVIIIQNSCNLGFGKANNEALKVANGKYILYLNSDTILQNNAINYYVNSWIELSAKYDIGALGSNLIDRNFNIVHSYGTFPEINNDIKFLCKKNIKAFVLLLFHIIKIDHLIKKKSDSFKEYYGEVDYITGADLFLKNDKNAFFDENFFMYYEETYLCKQLYIKKLKRIIIKGPKIQHIERASDDSFKNNRIKKHISFSSLQIDLSRFIYYRLCGTPTYKLFFLKILTYFYWMNPLIIKKAVEYNMFRKLREFKSLSTKT